MTNLTKILITDDDPLALLAAKRLLTEAGHEVLTTSTGLETLQIVQTEHPELVLLDVILPDIDGTEVCRQIKTDPKTSDIFVILLSGVRIKSDDQAEAMEGGADGYITRPIANRELLARIQAYLRIKAAEQTIKTYSENLETMVAERTLALQQAQEKLIRKETLSVLGQIAGSVSHELRSPIGVISNAIYYLQLLLSDANNEVLDYLKIIHDENNNAKRIVNELLDYTRVKSFEPQPADVLELLQRALKKIPAPPSVNLILQIEQNLPKIYADPHHVLQVMDNLINNAYQSMPEGGELTLSAQVQDEMILIRVQDTGIGISLEDQEKLFEPLFTTKTKGVGLGLVICKQLIETNNGRIDFQTEPDKGSVFTIFLPIYQEEAA